MDAWFGEESRIPQLYRNIAILHYYIIPIKPNLGTDKTRHLILFGLNH